MPIVLIRSNLSLTFDQSHTMMNAMAEAVSLHAHKPIGDVMVSFQRMEMLMDGSAHPALLADITSISKWPAEVKSAVCNALHRAVAAQVTIDSSRMYVHFHETDPELAWRFRDGKAIYPVGKKSVECGSDSWQTPN